MALLSISVVLLIICNVFLVECQPQVTLKLGKVKGTSKSFEEKKVNEYLGLPYAQPPVEHLRFKKPLPLTEPWDRELDATKWPKVCLQSSSFLSLFGFTSEMSENCLYLNIWSPEGGEELKPVMFFIHGGGYSYGSASQKMYDSLPLAAKEDVVVVVINYRLGALGFLFGGTSDTPGNVGLFDQALALEWVQDNIRYFGGDPERVTIFGESAGGMSVTQHILSPVSRNLFKNAIPMSGSALSPGFLDPKTLALKKARNLAKLVGCPHSGEKDRLSSEQIKCLKEADAQVIADTQIITEMGEGLNRHFFSSLATFYPIFGDEFMPRNPKEMLKEKDFKQKGNILMGVVNDEGALFEFMMSLNPMYADLLEHGTESQWKAFLVDFLRLSVPHMSESDQQRFVDFYFVNAHDLQSFKKAATHAVGDYQLGCPTVIFAEKVASVSNNHVYGYVFTHKTQRPEDTMAPTCLPDDEVCHALELPYMFGLPLAAPENYTDIDILASNEAMRIWSGIAKNDKLFWPQYMKTASGQIIPSIYEINPTKDRRVFNEYKYFTCKLWEPYLI